MTKAEMSPQLFRAGLVFLLALVAGFGCGSVLAQEVAPPVLAAADVDDQLKEAARFYAEKDYASAAALYRSLTNVSNAEQASWALELYGVCLERQDDRTGAMGVYKGWLQRYPDSASTPRVKQRLLALETAIASPAYTLRKSDSRNGDSRLYGSSSLFYRGMESKIDGGDSDTNISSISGDIDLHLRGNSENYVWRGRANGGYLSDQTGRGKSDARISKLFFGLEHEPSGLGFTIGRQRLTENGIYGYFDGATFSYALNDTLTVSAMGGTTADSSRDAPDNDRAVYGIGATVELPNLPIRLQFYGTEQQFMDLTERRAIGGELSYTSDRSHYLFVVDYDIEFEELNNAMFSGNWNASPDLNLALSVGYQRSPFLAASNAIIGEYDLDVEELLERLSNESDIYDAALDKTALSQYASLVVNWQPADDHRIVAELYHFELSDLPSFDENFEAPDSDANTTLGLQYIVNNALVTSDALSLGARYTQGDTSDSASVYLHERLRLGARSNIILRLLASRRESANFDQEMTSLRPGIRLDWYLTRQSLIDLELGYEWSSQEFRAGSIDLEQAFLIIGFRTRF